MIDYYGHLIEGDDYRCKSCGRQCTCFEDGMVGDGEFIYEEKDALCPSGVKDLSPWDHDTIYLCSGRAKNAIYYITDIGVCGKKYTIKQFRGAIQIVETEYDSRYIFAVTNTLSLCAEPPITNKGLHPVSAGWQYSETRLYSPIKMAKTFRSPITHYINPSPWTITRNA